MNRHAQKTTVGLRTRVVDWALSLLALAGVTCIVLVILGALFNVSIMMFRTGSMSPTITAGSIALVREIPATELAVGDIATVDRGPGQLPVTHRVTTLLDTDQSGTVRFEMRGDANEAADPMPYTAQSVKLVFFSLPKAAPVIQWFGNPYALGGLTIGASVLVVWAFWPRQEEKPAKQVQHSLAVPAAALLAVSMLAPGATRDPDILQLRSHRDAQAMQHMSPGDSAQWVVEAWAESDEPGEITLSLGVDPSPAAASSSLVFSVAQCQATAESGMDAGCPQGSTLLLEPTPAGALAASPARELTTFDSSIRQRLVITGTMLGEDHGASASLMVVAAGMGDEATATPERQEPEQLPAMGSAHMAVIALAAMLVIVVGGSLLRRSNRGTDVQAK